MHLYKTFKSCYSILTDVGIFNFMCLAKTDFIFEKQLPRRIMIHTQCLSYPFFPSMKPQTITPFPNSRFLAKHDKVDGLSSNHDKMSVLSANREIVIKAIVSLL